MGIYQVLVTAYNQLISAFPSVLQWRLTVARVVGVAVFFVCLIRSSLVWVILLVLLLPVLLPIVWGVFLGIWHFLLYLLVQVGLKAPA